MGFFGMTLAYIAFTILHFFQFVLALVVCGLYGTDLDRARKAGKYADGKWVRRELAQHSHSKSNITTGCKPAGTEHGPIAYFNLYTRYGGNDHQLTQILGLR